MRTEDKVEKKPIKQEKASHRLFMIMSIINIISISEICGWFVFNLK